VTIIIVTAAALIHILDASLVAPAESVTILMARIMRNIRMPIFIAILHVWLPVILEVAPCALDAVVESTPRDVAPVVIRNPRPWLVVIARRRRRFLLRQRCCSTESGQPQAYD
jgi:hypothetical protein